MKRMGALVLAAALTCGLPALAAESPEIHTIVLNGQVLDTAGQPAVLHDQYLPMRLVAEADHGSAAWYEEDNQGWFTLDGLRIVVDFSDNSVTVNDEPVEETAWVAGGVTYLPYTVLEKAEGYAVAFPEGAGSISITTPNSAPLVQLAYTVREAAGLGAGMKVGLESLGDYGIQPEHFTQAVSFFPMITSPDTLILGQVAEGHLEELKAELEAYRQSQEDTFSWYLGQHLPKVQNAQVVVEGDYILFLIAENPEAGVEVFQSGLAALTQAE